MKKKKMEQKNISWESLLIDVKTEIDKIRRRLADFEQSKYIIQEKINNNETFPNFVQKGKLK